MSPSCLYYPDIRTEEREREREQAGERERGCDRDKRPAIESYAHIMFAHISGTRESERANVCVCEREREREREKQTCRHTRATH